MKQKLILFFILLGLTSGLMIFLFFKNETPDKNFSNGEIVLIKIGQTEVMAELAVSEDARERGLSGRETLAPGSGMLFIFSEPAPRKFWMKGMKFPIDIIWIRDGEVIDWVASALPPSLTQGEAQEFLSPEPVDMVLEVPVGFAAQNQIMKGEKVTIKQ